MESSFGPPETRGSFSGASRVRPGGRRGAPPPGVERGRRPALVARGPRSYMIPLPEIVNHVESVPPPIMTFELYEAGSTHAADVTIWFSWPQYV